MGRPRMNNPQFPVVPQFPLFVLRKIELDMGYVNKIWFTLMQFYMIENEKAKQQIRKGAIGRY